MLDSGGISRIYRNTDQRKVLIAFCLLSTETAAGAERFSFISSKRMDFKKRQKRAKFIMFRSQTVFLGRL